MEIFIMFCTREAAPGVHWVGADDRRLALFENLFPIPRGVSYNAYLVLDERTALIDTVDAAVRQPFLENVAHVLSGRALDYLIVNHMEPDHCANIEDLLLRYPSLTVVGNEKTLRLITQFYPGMDLAGRTRLVRDGETLTLGERTLRFLFAPMVHWPEVMMTFLEPGGLLFSADAFGSFGALGGLLFEDEVDFERDWLDDARRYYTNIVGKYGPQVQAALRKAGDLPIRRLCPLHGPVWREHLPLILEKYDRWSRYEPEERAVAVFYASMYGNTENAARILAASLADAGVHRVAVHDVSGTHISTLIAECFRCSHLVFAAPTYNMGLYPPMETLLRDMKALNLQNRTAALIENGSWACRAGEHMRRLLGELPNLHVLEPALTLCSALRDDQRDEMARLRDALIHSLRQA